MEIWTQCSEELERRRYGPLRGFFVCMPVAIDRFWRKRDFALNRSYGGPLKKVLGVDGHSPLAVTLPSCLLLFLVYGHFTLTGVWVKGPWVFAFLLMAWAALLLGVRILFLQDLTRHVLWFQLTWIATLSVVLWASGGERLSDPGLYRHLLVPFLLVLAVLPIVLAWILAALLFKGRRLRYRSAFRDVLTRVELFATPRYPDAPRGKVLRSLINAPLRYPLPLLFFPAMFVLFLPQIPPNWVRWIGGIVLLCTSLFLSFATIHRRFDAMLILLNRTFFHGGQLLVSLFIVFLAVGRAAEFGYVSTVVEGSGGALRWYIYAAYFTCWYYEYWINRILSEELIGFLRTDDDPPGQARYPIDPSAVTTRVASAGRVIQIHGGARLVVVGRTRGGRGAAGEEAFETYERIDLFDRLAQQSFSGQPYRRERMALLVKDLRNRVRFYFSFLNLLQAVAFFSAGYACVAFFPQVPGVKTVGGPGTNHVDLCRLIFEPEKGTPRQRVVLLAASGGGTRAALYTTSVLHGLAENDALRDLVLASGVSGGSAAIAYFAAHRAELQARPWDRAWREFYDTMSRPFIQEVLQGASEWRVTAGTRLGQLLDESFSRHFRTNKTLGDINGLALIFNTSLAGHLHRGSRGAEGFAQWAQENRRLTKSSLAGSRLVFTNLKDPGAFPEQSPESHDLPYRVIRHGSVTLSSAAALSANFPPVFSNAAVDILPDKDSGNGSADRYWVTDGGATENRGILSLLFALCGALEARCREMVIETGRFGRPHTACPPEIHVIVADASAASLDYKQDRGLGSKFGAPEKIADALMQRLLSQARGHYRILGGKPEDLRFHYLAMPCPLRIRGGLGTHWMLPALVRVADAGENDPDLAQEGSELISSFQVRDIITRLHQDRPLYQDLEGGWLHRFLDSEDKLEKIESWIEEDPHRTRWRRLKDSLSGVPRSDPS